MTRDEFQTLLTRRDELERAHENACAELEEEGPDRNGYRYRKCVRLYDERQALQEQIDAEIAAETAAEEAAERAAQSGA